MGIDCHINSVLLCGVFMCNGSGGYGGDISFILTGGLNILKVDYCQLLNEGYFIVR